jgi:hypothetical protein
MTVIKNLLGRDHQDKRLRVEFSDGEIAEIKLVAVCECDEHQECNGIVYDLISTNRGDRAKKGATCWADSADVRTFEILGD